MTDRSETIICGRENEAFSKLFLYALENKFNSMIIIPDSPQADRFDSFIRMRTNESYKDLSTYKGNGIFISSNAEQSLIKGFSSIGIFADELTEELKAFISKAEQATIPVKVILYDVNAETAYWKQETTAVGDINYPNRDCELYNEKIRAQFIDTFTIAENEIDIICPWINSYVVNEELIKLIDDALSRNVRIKIIYGIGQMNDVRSATSKETVNSLIKRFSKYGEQLRFSRQNTHIKLMLCDDKYMMSGSYNFLSFAGDYSKDYIWDESVEYRVDPVIIAQRRQKYFSW